LRPNPVNNSGREFWRAARVAATVALVVAARDPAEARGRDFTIFEFPNAQYQPLSWQAVAGWRNDDQLQAFRAFQTSCRAVVAGRKGANADKPLKDSLRAPCLAARTVHVGGADDARRFFELHFVPLQLSKLGDAEGFVTGYFEPIVEGSRAQSDVFSVPVYRRPSNLFVRGFRQSSENLPNRGHVFRKIGRRKLVAFYDRGEIEEGALAGRKLEICWVKSQTDLLFMQIQGSARIRLEDGTVLRINYDAHNGHPYTPVGRVLIDRGIIPREEMSMQRIRQWIAENPDKETELRRQNKSYVFFREVTLSDHDEPRGAQGVALKPGRSIAVDKALHVYGTPLFVDGRLPIESPQPISVFQRLMIAQDTGSAIVGPARADIYFGAGAEAGRISGRLRHPARFVMLLPKALDPSMTAARVPLPVARPSAKIAKLLAAVEKREKPSSK
jgi:membrane-bound lytic murein transglycosylase A